MDKIASFVADCENQYGIKIAYQNKVSLHQIKKLRKKLYRIKKEENITFVHGIGRRKTPLQKDIEQLEGYISKLKEYTVKLHNCGSRNSYSKDGSQCYLYENERRCHAKNGQLKPAYNLQHGVDSEYITWLTIGPQPTDTTTLIPFLKDMEEYLAFKYKNITADSSYESEEERSFHLKTISRLHLLNREIMRFQKHENIKPI